MNSSSLIRTTIFCAQVFKRVALLLMMFMAAVAHAQPPVTLRSPNAVGGGFGQAVCFLPDINSDGVDELVVASPWEARSGQNGAGAVYLYDGATFTLLRTFVSPNPSLNGYFGFAVCAIQDLDSDGLSDLLISAYKENSTAGRVYVYSSTGTLIRTLSSAGTYYFGYSVATIGDLDSDAVRDILVGSPWESSSTGAVYVISGATGAAIRKLTTPFTGQYGYFGQAVASMPDVTGDGIDDVIVGARGEGSGSSADNSGNCYIMNGATGELVRAIYPSDRQYDGKFGFAVAGIHDVDGDGKGDVVIGAPYHDDGVNNSEYGKAYIYSGGTGSLLFTLREPSPRMTYADFGYNVAGMPDQDGDGVDDVLIGATWAGTSGCWGRVFIFSGKTGTLFRTLAPVSTDNSGAFGTWIATGGDLNNDGYSDVLVGSPEDQPTGYPSYYGGAYLFYSDATPKIAMTRDGSAVAKGATIDFGTVYQEFHTPPEITFTVRNNGLTALTTSNASVPSGYTITEALAATIAPGTTDSLTVQLTMAAPGTFAGQLSFDNNTTSDNPFTLNLTGTVMAPDSTPPTVSSITPMGTSPTNNPTLQFRVVFDEPVTGVAAGNFSVDAPTMTGGSILSVTGSATTWTLTVARGAGSGSLSIDMIQNLSSIHDTVGNAMAVAFTAGEAFTIDAGLPFALSSPNPEDAGYYGICVASVPDLTGDGIDDFVVGAQEDPGSSPEYAGRVYVYNGATGGLLRTMSSPNEASGQFGDCVDGVPDVDGDGLGDIIVGASAENLGRAYLFSGATGALLQTFEYPNVYPSTFYGASVAGLGDITGDGRGDIAIGARSDSVGTDGAGAVYVYNGVTGAQVRRIGSPNPEANGQFGISVASMPDVTGDDMPEIAIGADQEDPGAAPADAGACYVFNGATGTLLQTLLSPNAQAGTHFGYSVAGMPDIAGDGAGELIVGAFLETNGFGGAGRAYVFNGATGASVFTITSPAPASMRKLGWSVSSIPDCTGDGVADLVSGDNATGVYIYSGATGEHVRTLNALAGVSAGWIGNCVRGVDDINGDGLGDVIVGDDYATATGNPASSGAVLVFFSQTAPEADLYRGAAVVNDGGTVDFGTVLQGRAAPSITFTLRNSGALPLTTANLAVPAGYTIDEGLSPEIAAGGSDTFTVTLPTATAGTFSGTISFDTNDTIENPYNITATGTVTADATAPTVVSIVRAAASPSAAGSVPFTVTFSEEVSGVTADNFSIDGADLSGASIGAVTGSGTTWTVNVNTGAGDGTVSIGLDRSLSAIRDLANNPLTDAYATGEVYTINKSAPSVISIVRAGASPTHASSVQFTVTFSEPVTGVAANNFSIDASGPAGAAVNEVTGSGTTWTVTVGRGSGDGTLSIDLNQNLSNIIDVVGNPMEAAYTAGEAYTIDTAPPTNIALSPSTIAENSVNDTVVGTLATTDPDPENTFTYSFVSPYTDASGRFKIVGSQVQVANGSLLNFESATSHLITVRTTDRSGLTYEKSLTILVSDANETPTNITLSASVVNENAANDTVIGNLTSSDPDPDSTFAYSLVAPNNDAGGRFKIVGSQLKVANRTLLDYEAATSHLITIRTTDNGGLMYEKSFTITVNNLNEAPTALSLSGNTIAENAANDTVVGSLTSTDQDSGATFTYFLLDAAGGRFKIVGDQVQVSDGSLLDYELATSHYITVRTTDNGGLTYDKTFTIALNDVNETPSDITLSAAAVNENAANDTVVGNLTSADPDAGATFTYSFVAPNADAGGRFKIVGDQIQVADGSLLDYESAASHQVTVRTTDNGGLTRDKTFTVTLNNLNEAPTDIALSTSTINENAANNTVIGNLTSADQDAGATFTYSFVAPNSNAGGRFKISGSQILVNNGTLLDYESATSHLVTVRTTDQGGLYYDKTFTITLNNVNEAPTNIILSAYSVNENSPNDTVVANVTTTDPDGGSTFTYTFVSPYYNADGRFKIVNGQLMVADGSLLNYEAQSSYGITIQVTDNGGLTYTKSFPINLIDVNEAPTNITLSASTISEHAANNSFVGIISSTDPDSVKTCTYSLVAPNGDAGGRFKIVLNQVQVANGTLLDYESATSHLITIRTTDQGGLYYDKTFTITVNNINEAPTDVALSSSAVDENAANNTVVGSLTTTDPDAANTFTYTFVSPNSNAGERFKIDGSQIQVNNSSLLNYEEGTSHLVTVRATDQGGLYFEKSFTITINNVNDAPSDIALSASAINENAANDTIIGNLSGTDQDPGATFTYSFVAPNGDAGGRFKIVGSQIQVADGSLLDYESATSHLVTVRTTDDGGLTFDKTFTITVINVPEVEAELLAGSTPIATGGGPIDFGAVEAGGTAPSVVFTLRNDGDGTLTTTNLTVPNGFAAFEGLSAQIAPGGSDTFTVILLTGAAGTFTGAVSFACNDADESLYQFTVTGTVTPVNTSEMFVDFGYLGDEFGTELKPFNTLAEGIAAVSGGGTLKLNAGTTAETPRITKAMRLEAVGGAVRIGIGGSQQSPRSPQPASMRQSPAGRTGAPGRNATTDWKLYR